MLARGFSVLIISGSNLKLIFLSKFFFCCCLLYRNGHAEAGRNSFWVCCFLSEEVWQYCIQEKSTRPGQIQEDPCPGTPSHLAEAWAMQVWNTTCAFILNHLEGSFFLKVSTGGFWTHLCFWYPLCRSSKAFYSTRRHWACGKVFLDCFRLLFQKSVCQTESQAVVGKFYLAEVIFALV